jgi:hypothetical protein
MTKNAGLFGLVGGLKEVKHRPLSGTSLDPKVAMLRAWQSRRLARTYQDLLADERHRLACEFFLDDIYGPYDFSQRDHDIEQMYAFTRRFVPDSMLRPLAVTVELHQLSETLDRHLLDVLLNPLGVVDTITPELYAEGYRLCDNYATRVYQIELIEQVCERIDGIVRNPLTGPTLSLAKRPLRSSGHVALVDFLERGYTGFKHMQGSQHFRATIRQRELSLLDRMYAGEANPFEDEAQ